MNKTFKFLEKSISIFTLLVGLLAFAVLIPVLSSNSIPFLSTELLHLKILAIMAVLGGVLLFFEKKSGWVISIAVCFSFLISIGFGFQVLSNHSSDVIPIIIAIGVLMVILICGIILLSKPFTSKYRPNLVSTLVIVLIVSYFLVDRMIAYKSTPAMAEVASEYLDINCKNKATILQAVYERDQEMRINGSILPNIDSENLATVISLIENCGMPTLAEVSEIQMSAIWLVFQHSNNANRKKYLPMLKVAAEKGDLSKRQIAMMEDRILMLDGKPQIYGTQILNDSLYTIIEPEKVNKRRAEIGFEPLEDYVSRWGIEFTTLQVE